MPKSCCLLLVSKQIPPAWAWTRPVARTRFLEGVADNREIIDAQAALAGSNDEMVEAVYQYNLSRLELAMVRGDVRLVVTE